MDVTKKFLSKIEAKKLPQPIGKLNRWFDSHLSIVNTKPEFVEQYLTAKDKCLRENFTAVKKVLAQIPISKLIAMKGAMKVCKGTLRELERSIEQRLRGKAVIFYPESSEEYRSLLFDEIAASLIQGHLTELFTKKELKQLLTKELITEVYFSSLSCFEVFTQAQFFSVEGNAVEVLRPLFLEKLELGIDLFTIESVRNKALKLIGDMRIKQMSRHIEEAFNKELAECRSGLPMDSDLEPASDKGKTMYNIYCKARECRNRQMENFSEECLARCIDQNKYQPPSDECHSSHVLACITKVFIGFINFRDLLTGKTDTLCCHPEVYLWMRRLLQTQYRSQESVNYFDRRLPKACSYLENRYLNALCRAAAQQLTKLGKYRRPDENLLRPEERILPSDSPVLDEVVFNTSQLNTTKSLLLLRCISGFTSEDNDENVSWSGTNDFDVSREAVCWKAERNIVALIIKKFKSAQLNAKRTGQYLALLIIHKRLQNRFLSFVGFSLGAKVILSCLEELGHYNLKNPEEPVYVTDVVLILGAVNQKKVDWSLVSSVVKGRFINVYSRDDQVLRLFFNVVSNNPIGTTEVVHDNVENCDVTRLCSDKLRWFKCQHLEARTLIKKIFKILELDP